MVQPRASSSVVYLLIAIAHLSTCTRHDNYNEYSLENEKFCHPLNKKHSHDFRNGTAAIVTSHHMFDRWIVERDFTCTFIFKTAKGESLFAVIHKMSFRRNGDQCLDYVRFKRTDGHSTEKFCGEIDRQTMYPTMYFSVPESEDNSHNIYMHDTLMHSHDKYAEFDSIKKWKPFTIMEPVNIEFETEIFISKERLLDGEYLDLNIVYTPYRSCKNMDSEQYKPTGHNVCIRKEYLCDMTYNCPLGICLDEFNCSHIITDRFPRDDTATKVTVVIIVIFCFIIFIKCLWICKESSCEHVKNRQRKKSNEQVLPPIMSDIELETLHEIPNVPNVQLNTLYSPMLEYNSDKYALIEIKRKEIRLEKLLGSGAFGMVFQGKVKNLERPGIEIPAAIKMLPENASSKEKKKFLEEARLMNHFRHKHVLRLLAVCLDKDSPLIVLELMETGDLLQYLRDSRKLQLSDSDALRLQDLFAMCEDVARGCYYLEDLRFVHRDLACRNCLVSARDRENRVIKIGDFGLARDVYTDDYYRKKGQGLLPVRWMAPESLVVGIFTSQSDVWSFGVLMWEITSLGERPYTGKNNEEVIDYVRARGRLPMPLNCPSTLYELMLRCWSPANDRPNFKLCLKNIIALRNNMEDILLSPVDII